jgi:catechol-2,3-dioxygenase
VDEVSLRRFFAFGTFIHLNRQPDNGPDFIIPHQKWSPLMEAQELHRGRLIAHIQLVVSDLTASKTFYEAALGALNIRLGGSADDRKNEVRPHEK